MKINNSIPQINNINNSQTPSFKGFAGVKKYVTDDLVKLQKSGVMARHLFFLNAIVFMLGARIVTSRDKDERREVMVRDIPTITIASLGVPILSKLIAQKLIQPKSGFAIMDEGGKSITSYDNIDDLYRYNKDLHSGFNGFSERLNKLGGNLKKIYSSLSDEVKNKLSNFSSDNKKFMEELNSNKELLETIKTGMTGKENAVLKRASFLKTVPTILGFATVLGSIGILIPKLNIYITEAIHKNKKNHEKREK